MTDRKIVKCKKCQCIDWEDEPHTCPTEQEMERLYALVSAAAQYDEDHWYDENGVHQEH